MRLFNDPRFFMLTEFERLTYIFLIALAKQTRNRIRKDWRAIGVYMRSNRSPTEVKSAVNRLLSGFDNLHQDKYNLWFSGWDERYDYCGVEEEKEKEKDKEKECSFNKLNKQRYETMKRDAYKKMEIPHDIRTAAQVEAAKQERKLK